MSKRIRIIRHIVFYVILGATGIFSSILSYVYIKFLPPLSSSFYQMIIQVIATLLGFTVVVIFYYLSKFDEQKKDIIKTIIQARKQLGQSVKLIDTAAISLKPNYGAPVKLRSSTQGTGALEDQVKRSLDSFIQFVVDQYETISSEVIGDVIRLVTSFGVGIALAFLGLFYVDSLHMQTDSWPLLIGIIVSSISTLYNFVMFWRAWQALSDEMYRIFLRLI